MLKNSGWIFLCHCCCLFCVCARKNVNSCVRFQLNVQKNSIIVGFPNNAIISKTVVCHLLEYSSIKKQITIKNNLNDENSLGHKFWWLTMRLRIFYQQYFSIPFIVWNVVSKKLQHITNWITDKKKMIGFFALLHSASPGKWFIWCSKFLFLYPSTPLFICIRSNFVLESISCFWKHNSQQQQEKEISQKMCFLLTHFLPSNKKSFSHESFAAPSLIVRSTQAGPRKVENFFFFFNKIDFVNNQTLTTYSWNLHRHLCRKFYYSNTKTWNQKRNLLNFVNLLNTSAFLLETISTTFFSPPHWQFFRFGFFWFSHKRFLLITQTFFDNVSYSFIRSIDFYLLFHRSLNHFKSLTNLSRFHFIFFLVL